MQIDGVGIIQKMRINIQDSTNVLLEIDIAADEDLELNLPKDHVVTDE